MKMALTEWDVAAEVIVGGLLLDYLEAHPAPEDSLLADDLREWGENLVDHGESDWDDLTGGGE